MQLVRNSTSPRLDLHGAFRYLLEAVGILHGYFHSYFGRFLNFAAHQEFVQDEISLLKVENDVQLAHLTQTQSHKNSFFVLFQKLGSHLHPLCFHENTPMMMLLK